MQTWEHDMSPAANARVKRRIERGGAKWRAKCGDIRGPTDAEAKMAINDDVRRCSSSLDNVSLGGLTGG